MAAADMICSTTTDPHTHTHTHTHSLTQSLTLTHTKIAGYTFSTTPEFMFVYKCCGFTYVGVLPYPA